MKILQAYKFELMPNGEQRRNMSRFAGTCRFVYNRALALQQESQKAGNGYIRYEEWIRNARLGGQICFINKLSQIEIKNTQSGKT